MEVLALVCRGIGIFVIGLLIPIVLMLYNTVYGFEAKLFCILLILLITIIEINIIWIKNRFVKQFLAIGIIIGILLLIIPIYAEYKSAKDSKLRLSSSVMSIDVNEYMPFDENSKIVKIKEPTLKVIENEPIVDGAAALFPVYSAFVNAVYSQERVEERERKARVVAKKDTNGKIESYEITRNYQSNQDESSDSGKRVLDKGIFQYNNTVDGYKKLARKETDIFIGAYPSEAQINYAKKNDTTFKFTPIGREGFVFFVNKNNPINNLTSDEIRKIYSGEITNWKDVGGKNKRILAFQRNEGSGSQSMLIRFMNGKKVKEPIFEDEEAASMGMIFDNVADYRNYNNSIGFSFRYYAEEIINNQDVKLISVDGIEPTLENISNGTYPITTDFYAVTYEENTNPNVDKFIEWILSEQGQYIIEETGYARIK